MGFESLTNPDCACCDRGGGGGGGANIPSCTCQGIPTTLTMTSSGDPVLIWQSCTFQWGHPPADASPTFAPTGFFFFSTAKFTDLITPASPFYYIFNCSFGIFSVNRFFPNYQGTGPAVEPPCPAWAIGTPGNSCALGSLTLTNYFNSSTSCASETSITVIG